MNLNPFAKEFQPSAPVSAKPIRTRKASDDRQPLATNNSSNHPNVGPGQQSFDLPHCLWANRPAQLPPAPSSAGTTSEDKASDDLEELDEASLLEHHADLHSKPALKASCPSAPYVRYLAWFKCLLKGNTLLSCFLAHLQTCSPYMIH